MNRPQTSKPRGVCRYYNSERGCFAGNKCKFLHAEQDAQGPGKHLTPYDQAKTCRYYADGYCRRGDKCWFLHTDSVVLGDGEDEDLCSICFEKPVTYGLLGGCSHVFCIQCIRQWRDPSGKSGDVVESGNTKKCPMCRSSSKFITPSSQFYRQDEPGKDKVITAYRESMARVPCRYFQQSMSKDKARPSCPFGKDCFYQHRNDDGTTYIFPDGVDKSMRVHARRRDNGVYMPFHMDFSVPFPILSGSGSGSLTVRSTVDDITQERFTEVMRRVWEQSGRGPASLETMTSTFLENPTLESLEMTMGAMRMGLELLTTRGGEEGGSGEAEGVQWGPVMVNGTLMPGPWDLEDEGARGWDGGDGGMFGQLEVLADHMLASLNAFSDVDHGRNETPSPVQPFWPRPPDDYGDMSELESISLEPSRTTAAVSADENGDGGGPALQSVSASSDEEGNVEGERAEDRGIRAFDRENSVAMETTEVETNEIATEEANGPESWWSFLGGMGFWGGSRSDETRVEGPPVPASTSGRFSTVVGPERQRMVIDIDDDEDGDEEEPKPATPSNAPPFVTDGRGRVVWTSSSDGRPMPLDG